MSSQTSGREERLSTPRLMAFVSPEAPMAAFISVFFIFVPPFYAGSMGLGLSAVGLIFGLTKLWDVVTDPVFGVLSDRWHSRWGRRRHWLVLSLPIFLTSIYMTFVPGTGVSGLYLTLWLVLLYVGWTLASMSHISWAAELSVDYHERSRIQAFRQGAGLLGAMGLLLMVAFADQTGGFSEAGRLELIGTTIIISLPVLVLIALWAAPEPKRHAVIVDDRHVSATAILIRNSPLRRLLLANLLLVISVGSIGGMFMFFVEDVLLLGEWASFALIPLFLSGLLFLPLCMRLARRIGKHRALCAILVYQLIANLLFLIIPADNIFLASSMMLLIGAVQAVVVFIPAAIMSDVVDVDTAVSGRRRTGLYMSLLQCGSKIGAALAVGLSYPLLNAIGYDPSPEVVNAGEVLDRIRWLMMLLPGLLYVGVIFIMWNFPLGEGEHAMLREKIESVGAVKIVPSESGA